MKRTAVLIASLWLVVSADSAHAQLFFNPFRKATPPVPPEQRVGQLISIIKSETDESKRSAAVVELRDLDAKAFPQIVDVLADVAQTDPKAGVRADAVSGLVRIRPVSATAGQAIEHVASKDENWRNRMNAQAALVRYRLAGYSSTMPHPEPRTQAPTPKNQSAEPPLAAQPPTGTPGSAPPIIYHDQFGKVIPTPKGMPATGIPGQGLPGSVIGTPTSNPGGKSPFAPIGPATPPMAVPPAPVSLSPVAPPTPVAVEPVFRNVNPPIPTPQPASPPAPLPLNPGPIVAPPTVPASAPAIQPQPAPALGPSLGPSLDLPPLPINPTPPPTPAPAQPSGRMEPSPRLSPMS